MSFFYFLLAFGVSVWLLKAGHPLTDDGTNYLRMAEHLITGQGVSINLGEIFTLDPPFYSVVTGLASLFFSRNLEFAGGFVSSLSFSLTLIPLFLLSRSIYGGKSAHWTCLLFLTNGFLLVYSYLILTEPLFTFLIITLLYQFHEAIQREKIGVFRAVMLGLTGGIAYLTRPEGFLFYGVGLASFLLLSPQPFRARFRTIIPALAVFLLFLLPYLKLVHQDTKAWQLSGGVVPELIRRQLDVSHPDQYREVKKIDEGLSRDKKRLKIDELAEEFSVVRYLTAGNFAILKSIPQTLLYRILEFNKYLFGGLGLLFMGACFLGAPWDTRRKRSECLLLFYLVPFLAHLFVYFIQKRYLPIYPIFLLWIGHGIEVLRNWTRRSFQTGEKKSIAVALGVCLFLAFPSFAYVRRHLGSSPVPAEHQEMGLWMKRHIPKIAEEKLATRRPFISFYAGANYLWLPYVDRFEDLLIYMKHQKAKYFVVSDDLDSPTIDSYRFLLDESLPPPSGLSRVHLVKGSWKVILYEVTQL